MSEGNAYPAAASGPPLYRRFTARTAIKPATKPPIGGPANPTQANVGVTMGRTPPTQATTNFQTVTNPVSHVRIPPQASARGNHMATSNMMMSMRPAFNGAINAALPKPYYTNTNAAVPWLKTYGPSRAPATAYPAESSQFAVGGGGPAILRNKNRTSARVLKAGG